MQHIPVHLLLSAFIPYHILVRAISFTDDADIWHVDQSRIGSTTRHWEAPLNIGVPLLKCLPSDLHSLQ